MIAGLSRLVLKISLIVALGTAPAAAQVDTAEPIVIAHRGASGERPEHTLAAYEKAIDQGADYIEMDLVATSDMILVARHENELSDTTDVGSREEFADRKRSKTIDGRLVSGWFAEDFTLAELRTLRAKERLPALRPGNARFDGLYAIPTFAEILQLVRAKQVETGRTIGIYPELKHPTFLLQDAGIDTVDLLVTALREADLDDADAAVFVQCFEVAALRRLDRLVDVPLVQLVSPSGGPADEPAVSYAAMVTPSGMADVASYADVIGPETRMVLEEDGTPSALVTLAHAAGLKVHAWTLRKENAFLPPQVRRPGSELDEGCYNKLYAALAAAGVDGVFTDNPNEISEEPLRVWTGWCASE